MNRINPRNELSDTDMDMSELIREWVSYRGQTLYRTGMGDCLIFNLLNTYIIYRYEFKI